MHAPDPTRHGLKHAAGALLAVLLAVSGPALAGKKDDTVRFAYDQAPESVDPFFNNVRIPKSNILGGEKAVGQGFIMLMKELAWERMVIAVAPEHLAAMTDVPTVISPQHPQPKHPTNVTSALLVFRQLLPRPPASILLQLRPKQIPWMFPPPRTHNDDHVFRLVIVQDIASPHLIRTGVRFHLEAHPCKCGQAHFLQEFAF